MIFPKYAVMNLKVNWGDSLGFFSYGVWGFLGSGIYGGFTVSKFDGFLDPAI